jgi:hypothetical protein
MAKDIILKTGTYLQVVTNKDIASGKIPGASLEKFVVNLLKSPTCCVKYVALSKANYTQATSLATTVATTTPAGEITPFSALTTGAGLAEGTGFTVTNAFVTADSVVLANVTDYSVAHGTNGLPQVIVDDVAAGSFKLIIVNGGANALNGTIKIGYSIF